MTLASRPLAENALPPGLAKPTQRALAGVSIHNLEQLSRCSEAQVARLHGIGPNAGALPRQAPAAPGLVFAPNA